MKAIFIRKAVDIAELKEETAKSKARKCEYIVEKHIKLTKLEWQNLTLDFFGYKDYIEKNINLMYSKDHVQHCLLVTCDNAKEGVLIQSEGYGYARYTAIAEEVEQ